jgi:hypothetical protein
MNRRAREADYFPRVQVGVHLVSHSMGQSRTGCCFQRCGLRPKDFRLLPEPLAQPFDSPVHAGADVEISTMPSYAVRQPLLNIAFSKVPLVSDRKIEESNSHIIHSYPERVV